MKRFAVLSLIVVLAAGALAQKHQANSSSSWVHVSGGDATSWALIRVSGGGVANVGDMDGIHIGEVRTSELIIVRNHKGYISTDEKLMDEVQEIRKPLDKAREERMKVKGDERGAKLELSSASREKRQLAREKARLERDKSRTHADVQSIDREEAKLTADEQRLESKVAGLQSKVDSETKRVEAADKNRDAIRDEIEKKLEKVFDTAISSGRAHPM